MSKEIFVAFATQKGGIGKSTVTALAASYLHNVKGYNVAVVDCDDPQHSIHGLREHEMGLIDSSTYFKALACDHFRRIKKNAYTIVKSNAVNALDDAERMIATEDVKPDVVFFDMPGTLRSNGVIKTLSQMDYIFTPLSADRFVVESTLKFVTMFRDRLMTTGPVSYTHLVREVGRLRQVGFPEGALLRAAVQGAESGQDAGGLLHQTVRFSRAVPRNRYKLQPSREGTEAAFFREKGDGVALQAGATDRRTRETEPPDCGTFKGNGGEMVAKISVGSSLYGAIAYNGEKINEAKGRLLTTNRIYNDGSGTVDINKAMEGFHTFLPPQMKVEKPVVHISLNPHPDDVLTDAELQDIAREYLEKLGFGNQPYLVFKHEDK